LSTLLNEENPSSGRRRIVAIVLATIAVLALVAGLAMLRGRPAVSDTPTEKLSLALSTTPHAALLHLAAAKGYFADEGLEVGLVPVSHGKAALELLAEGRIDLAAAAEVPFVISVLQGEPFSIVANVLSVSNEMAVIARRDRAIAEPRDLAGKRVGVTLGTSGEYFLWAFLTRHKLAPEAVGFVDVPPGRMVQEVRKGTVDAVATWQPIRLQVQTHLGENGSTFIEPNAYTVTHVVVARSDVLKQRPKAVQKLLRALLKAEHFVRTEPEQALALAAERLRLDAQSLRPAWGDLEFQVNLSQSQLITLEDEARWAIARGHAKARGVPSFLPFLYLDGLLALQPKRVTVVH
jgi:NitT/TauT family transport system substrate-binding protein